MAPALATIDTVVCADCLDALAEMPAGIASLAYLDPPFNTGRSRIHGTDRGRGAHAYRDRWPDIDEYLRFMQHRVEAVHRVLSDEGAILLHCDWRTSHHLRLLLDDVFGPRHFVNHLVWSYGLGGSSPRRFARKHDDILFYGRSDDYYFDPPRVAASSQRLRGQTKKATDVIDIPAINNMAKERTGYPTQKPVALLELLVCACSPPGGLVIDPFCGSGTTLAAARRTGRRFFGIDRNPEAVAIAVERIGDEPRMSATAASGTRPARA